MDSHQDHYTPKTELNAWLTAGTDQPVNEADDHLSPLSVLARQRQYLAPHDDGAALAPLLWLARHRRWMRRA